MAFEEVAFGAFEGPLNAPYYFFGALCCVFELNKLYFNKLVLDKQNFRVS